MDTTETIIYCIFSGTIFYILVKGVIAISRPVYVRWRKLTYSVGSDGRPLVTYEMKQLGHMTREEEGEERKMAMAVGIAAERAHTNWIKGSTGNVRNTGYGRAVHPGVSSGASYRDYWSPSPSPAERPYEERARFVRWDDTQEVGDTLASQPVKVCQPGSRGSATGSTNGTERRRSERLAAKTARRH